LRLVVVDSNAASLGDGRRHVTFEAVDVTFAASPDELSAVLRENARPDILFVSLTGSFTEHDVVARVKEFDYHGPIVVNADRPSAMFALLNNHAASRCLRGASCALLGALAGQAPAKAPRVLSAPAAEPRPTFHGIVGNSRQITEVFGRIQKVALGEANVCIYGESGTGKELIARAIHYASPRRDRPMITLDCTTIPEGLMESLLLGHVRGAFTGAVDHRDGVFSLASTGTLFIDELSELPLPLQAKLLRVIQSREFVPVGGTKPIRTDVRIVTATNKDLKQEVERGRLREDLYYRVAVFMINVPALRDRKDDIPALVDHFLAMFARRYNKAIVGVEPAAMRRLIQNAWLGNVRQLQNVIEQAVVLAESELLTEFDLFGGDGTHGDAPTFGTGMALEPGLTLQEVERRHVLATLARAHGNRTEAARVLGISLRGLQYRLKSYQNSDSSPTA
jgi:transcriptional regulator with PAS, ATPase and Fis domain